VAGPPPADRAAVPEGARRALALLIVLRVAYAYNWFDVGPALPALGQELAIGPAEWGVLLAAFLAGAGLLQVPAGLLASRYGPRPIALLGVTVLGGAGLAAAAAPSFALLVALRAVAGAGAGLFFAPAIGLVAALRPPGRRGIAVGTFSSAFSLGAAIGVFATAVLVPAVGWRTALATGGLLLLGATAIAVPWVPRSAAPPAGARRPPLSSPALRSPAVWAMGFAFVGLEGASLSAGQYFVPFAEAVRGWSPALAGGVASLFVFPSLFGGPVGGALTERSVHRRSQMAVATAIGGLLLFLVPYAGLVAVAAIATVFAFSYGATYAMMYVLAPYLPGLPASDVPLAIGLFNAIQIGGGSLVSLAAGVLIAGPGYTAAWLALGAATLLPLVLLAALPRTRPGPVPGAAGL